MTLTQLEYIIAVYRNSSFSKAAKFCYVTQPTLSQQVQKLEDSLQVIIFDRGCSPVRPTLIGKQIIEQALTIISESQKIKELIDTERNIIQGPLKLGVIPSIADSLIPLFLKSFSTEYPKVELSIFEMQTSDLLLKLKDESLDVAIAATPLYENTLREKVIYYEPFSLYLPPKHSLLKQKKVKESDMDKESLLMMSEGNCFKHQVSEFCRLKENHFFYKNINFESSSFETLIKLVDIDLGITVLPYLSVKSLSSIYQKKRVRDFSGKIPSREVSLVFRRSALKQGLLDALYKSIRESIPSGLCHKSKQSILLSPLPE